MSMELYDCTTQCMSHPIGLDAKNPEFAWKLQSENENVMQKSYHITVRKEKDGEVVWDSGIVWSRQSVGIKYEGTELVPCTAYVWRVIVMTEQNEKAECMEQKWETGFLDTSMKAWNGAKWIGPSEYTLCADVRSVFGVNMHFRIGKGSSCAGLIIGRNDRRIKERENYFRFDIDIRQMPAKLLIYRVGISEKDKEDQPIAELPVVDYDSIYHEQIITQTNQYAEHTLDVKITGNCAYTSVDGKRIDVTTLSFPWGESAEAPRQLNPFGNNDVNTYPRLNEIGFYVPAGQEAFFDLLEVRNLRKPYAIVFSDHTHYEIKADQKAVLKTLNPSHTSIPMLRSIFRVSSDKEKQVEKARLYATARGIYECRINGEKITETFFNPGATQYDRHIQYQTYDITDQITAGDNAVGIVLASGWWSDAQTYVLGNYNYYGDRESFLGKIVITYTDGSEKIYVTDTKNWKYCGNGPWTYAGFFHGEHYDAVCGEHFRDFAEVSYQSDSNWTKPEEIAVIPIYEDEVQSMGKVFHWPAVNCSEPELIGQIGSGVGVVGELTAVSVNEVQPGVYIYDMGVNVAGIPKVRLYGNRAEQAQLRYAEVLCPDLPEFAGRAGTLMVENLRDADCTDRFVFAGNPEGELYMPQFTFHGYRYIEISGVKHPSDLSEIKLLQLSSVSNLTGNMQVSNPLVNRFLANVMRSMRSNFISIPTDCPQRNERMGWNGDTSIFARSATFYADVRLFYEKWLMDARDLQEQNGRYTDIAPIGGGFGGYTYDSAPLHVAWELYQQYADIQVIWDNYDSMTKYMDYSAKKWEKGDLKGPMTLGDWLAPEETDISLICHAFYGYNARIMSKMAKAIGRQADAQKYRQLYDELKESFNRQYLDHKTGKTKEHTQCSYALPLSYGMITESNFTKVGAQLAAKTKEIGYLVQTGFFGTAPLCPMLTETGYVKDAYRLMEQTKCPSWLYPVTQGATSVWERWDSYTEKGGFGGHNNMNSFNHYSLGAVSEWFYRYVLGIRRDEDHPGYQHFTAKPEIAVWKYAKGGFESPFGRIEASWERIEERTISREHLKKYRYQLTVPANTSATVVLQDGSMRNVGSGTYEFLYEITE